MTKTAQHSAESAARALFATDHASQGLGMSILAVAPGVATVTMTIRPDMTNGHGICHGGFIFALADSAFAFACNSHNQRHVAQNCQITYLAPGRLGARLTATAAERHRADRSGITDVTVTDQGGTIIAEFRGHSRSIPGVLVPE